MDFTLKELEEKFKEENYICDRDILVPVYLSLKLKKPLLITGAPGLKQLLLPLAYCGEKT
jgi:hypothetical protein